MIKNSAASDRVLEELKNRDMQDIFIACVDGLKGFPEAIETVYPYATVQLCIVHMVRNWGMLSKMESMYLSSG